MPARRSTAFVTGYLQGVALVLGVLVLLFLLSYVIF